MQKVSRKGGKGEGRRRRRRKRNWVLQCLSKRASNVCATHTERVVTHRLSRGWVAVAVAEELGRGGGERRIGGGRGADAEAEASSPHSISIYGQEGPLRLRGLGVLEGKRRGTYLLAGSGGRRRERVRHNEWCGVRGAIDSSFNLVATHPS